MNLKLGATIIFALFLMQPLANAANYEIDRSHSTVGFKVKHLFTNVQGTFNDFSGTLHYDPDNPDAWSVEALIQVESIDTGVEARDEHLRAEDFFNVTQYPTISFHSTKVTDVTSDGAKIHGILELHGEQKPVALDLEIHGVGKGPRGNTLAGFTATTTIDRRDFGLTWNKVLEAGQVVVGHEVKITIEVEAIQQRT